jgi:hypothetical protein
MTTNKPSKKGSKRRLQTQFIRCVTVQISESESSSTSHRISARGWTKTIHRSITPELHIEVAPLPPPPADDKLFEVQGEDDREESVYIDSHTQAQQQTQVLSNPYLTYY